MWRSKFVLFSSSRVSSLLSLKTNESIISFFINNNYLKKLRLKNNLSKSNQKLRDVITKRNMIMKSHLRNGYEKTYNT